MKNVGNFLSILLSCFLLAGCLLNDDNDNDNDQKVEVIKESRTLVNPRQVSVGNAQSCALDEKGVVCWGATGNVDVPLLDKPTYVSVGSFHACAIDSIGVKCWGGIVLGCLMFRP